MSSAALLYIYHTLKMDIRRPWGIVQMLLFQKN